VSLTEGGDHAGLAHDSSAQSELERMACLSGTSVEARMEDSLRSFWLDRAAQHTHDSYAGVPLSKFPEDLRVYEHLLWADRPNVVIEIGTHYGASALWFRDRLRTLAAYGLIAEFRVITIDIEADRARSHLDRADPKWEESISLVSGDVCDQSLPNRVAQLLPPVAHCFVVEDSAHLYDTTMAALTGFSRFVAPGGFLVVEDGCVDIESMRLDNSWPRGVLPAVADWLADPAGHTFVSRRDLELYGLTCHPGGLLQHRVKADSP
jgi:cephalosporin hydroxylase